MRHMRIQKIPKRSLVSWLFKSYKQINLFSLSVSCNCITVVILYCLLRCPFVFVCLSIIPTVFPTEFPLTLCFQWFVVTASRKGSVMFSWLMSLFNACVSVCILGFIKGSDCHWHHQFDYIIINGLMSNDMFWFPFAQWGVFIDGIFEWKLWRPHWHNAAIQWVWSSSEECWELEARGYSDTKLFM